MRLGYDSAFARERPLESGVFVCNDIMMNIE